MEGFFKNTRHIRHSDEKNLLFLFIFIQKHLDILFKRTYGKINEEAMGLKVRFRNLNGGENKVIHQNPHMANRVAPSKSIR